jgi:hypothetical protein
MSTSTLHTNHVCVKYSVPQTGARQAKKTVAYVSSNENTVYMLTKRFYDADFERLCHSLGITGFATILAQMEEECDTIRFGGSYILRRWWRREFSTGSFELFLPSVPTFKLQVQTDTHTHEAEGELLTLSPHPGLVHRPSNAFIAWPPAQSGLTSIQTRYCTGPTKL